MCKRNKIYKGNLNRENILDILDKNFIAKAKITDREERRYSILMGLY